MKIFLTALLVCTINVFSYAQAKTTRPTTAPSGAKTTTTTKATPAKTPIAKPKPVEYADLSLDSANPPLPLIIKAPVCSRLDYNEGIVISSDSTYSVVIDISYSDMPKSIAGRKKDAQDNEVFKVQRFLIDKPDMILYETVYAGKHEFHFDLAREIRGEKYYLHDRWAAETSFTQKQIEAMLESAKSLRLK